jgi:hypothetical protein
VIGVILALAMILQTDAEPPIAPAPRTAAEAAAETLSKAAAAQAAATQEQAAPAPLAPPAAPSPPAPSAASPPSALYYESGVRTQFQAQEARQGPLDGRWSLDDADGKALFDLQLADPGPGRGPVEGAWRDLGRQGALDETGFIAGAERVGQTLTLSFSEPPQTEPWTAVLTQGADGRWSGQMRRADQILAVVMTPSAIAQASSGPPVLQPPGPTAHRATARPRPKPARAKPHRRRAAPKCARGAAGSNCRAARH